MKQGKRLFAILLALVMIVCSCPLSAFAVNDGTQEGEESFIAPSVTLKADKENYTDGEEIFISAKVKNTADKAQDVKLKFNSTYFVSMEKKTEKVSLDANGKTDVSFTATASHRIFENTKVQRVYDIILGFVFTLIYRITCMFRSDTEFCGFSVDGVPSGVMCTAGKFVDDTTEPTQPDEPDDPDIPDGKMFKATFLMNDGSIGVYKFFEIAGNSKIPEPENPEKDGYSFIGWYNEPSCVTKYDFNKKVKGDTTLYAGWSLETSTLPVSGGSSGGETVYSITDFEVTGNKVVVTINVNDYSALAVSFEDEATGNNVGTISAATPDYCENEKISIDIDFNLPEYFVAHVKLLDEDGQLRCPEYTSIKYTEAHKKFEEQTIFDFDQERVVNFDSSTVNNFGVLSDDVMKISQESGKNVVTRTYVKSDEVDSGFVMSYKFENVDSVVSELKIGDKVYALDSDGYPVLFKIGNICVEDDGSYIFTESLNNSFDEFYDVLKVDSEAWKQQSSRLAKARGRSIEIINEKSPFKQTEISIPVKYHKENSNFSFEGGLTGTVGGEYEFEYNAKILGEDYVKAKVSTKIEVEVKAEVTVETKFVDKDETLLGDMEAYIPTPVPGVNFIAGVELVCNVKGEATANINANIMKETGFSYDSKNGNQQIDKKSRTIGIDTNGKVEAKFGPNLKVGIGVLGNVISGTLNVEAGVKAIAELDVFGDNLQITDAEDRHACGLCLKGEAKWYVEGNIKVSYEICKKLSGDFVKFTLAKLEGNIPFIGGLTTYYISVVHSADSCFGSTMPHMGFGSCPNKSFRTRIILKDDEGNDIIGKNVVIKKSNGSTASQGNSPLQSYLYEGKYTVSTEISGNIISKTVVVTNSAQDVTITKDSADGKIEGKVTDMNTSLPIKGANVKISKGTMCVDNLETDENGAFSINVPDGIYNVEISLLGYIPFSQYIEIKDSSTVQLQRSLMISESGFLHGGLSGTIRNAVNNEKLNDVKITLYSGWDNRGYTDPIKTVKTDNNGLFKFKLKKVLSIPLGSLEAGNYTVKAEKLGYITTFYNVVVRPNSENDNQNGTLSPKTDDDVYRIVLTWGNQPADLDSHYIADTFSGYRDHVYYSNKRGQTAWLDVDDTNYEGPETITVTGSELLKDGFTYYVHDYSNGGNRNNTILSKSDAKVELKQGSQTIKTYYVPLDQIGTVWTVFKVDSSGNVIDVNTFGNSFDVVESGSNGISDGSR